MYTQCPECKTQHTIDTEQLRSTRGMLKCRECATMFDALEFISEQPLSESQEPKRSEFLPEERLTDNSSTSIWRAGFGLGLVLLIGQFIYFERYRLSQNPALRPWLTQICRNLGCQLPDYKNVQEISILGGSLEARDSHSFRFKAVIVNQAHFSQPYPDVRLTLVNFTGEPFAERIFSAADYLPSTDQLPADESAEIILDIAAPHRKIGGYNFKLL